MTKTLTEQWRKGTLPEGWYYTIIKGFTDKELMMIDYYIPELHHFEIKPSECILQVLAPVPSYDEIKRLQEQLQEANEMLKGAKHLTVKDSNGAVMFELVSPEINEYLKKWGVK